MCGACSTRNDKIRGVEKIRIEKSFGRCDVNARYELNLEVIKPKGLKPTTVAWIIDTAYSKTDTNNIEIKSEKQKCYVTFKSKGKTRIIAKADSVEKKITLTVDIVSVIDCIARRKWLFEYKIIKIKT